MMLPLVLESSVCSLVKFEFMLLFSQFRCHHKTVEVEWKYVGFVCIISKFIRISSSQLFAPPTNERTHGARHEIPIENLNKWQNSNALNERHFYTWCKWKKMNQKTFFLFCWHSAFCNGMRTALYVRVKHNHLRRMPQTFFCLTAF